MAVNKMRQNIHAGRDGYPFRLWHRDVRYRFGENAEWISRLNRNRSKEPTGNRTGCGRMGRA